MSIAPHTGIVDFGTFTAPTASTDGIQGEVPQPLAGQEGYVLTGTGWASAGSVGLVGYQGTWNALTNTPTLTSSVGVQGYYYVVDVAGTTNLNGITDWQVGDWAIFNGSIWQKVDNTDSYDPANVAITGGTINNTTIGATTPSTGVFTTLTATGQTSLGGVAGAEGLRVTPLASSTTYINARAGINGGNAQIGLVGTGNTDFVFYTLGTGAYRFLTGGIGPDQFRIAHTASAVNYVQVTGAATGSNPAVSAQGSDANVGLTLQSKGTFGVSFRNSSNGNIATITHAGSATPNYVQLGANVSGQSPFLASTGNDTNVDLTFYTKGTGAIRMNTGNGEQVRVIDSGVATTSFLQLRGGAGGCLMAPGGASSEMTIGSSGGFNLRFMTQGSSNEQLRIANTSSAVNYVQVTGAATGGLTQISSQGSDTNISIALLSKGTGSIRFVTSGTSSEQFRVLHTAGTIVNYATVTGSAASSSPVFSVAGSDTNIDLNLTPKGTGNVVATTGQIYQNNLSMLGMALIMA